ncbi:unnamed protein product [Spirodela intermedia]|uniref:Uncharacterized protein n=1 Tax=Spirodela intermedia TaxID=51605 RepID=A0A7I8KR43_SPIIN|nr:unnamed protein product [Spirodela intermedia]
MAEPATEQLPEMSMEAQAQAEESLKYLGFIHLAAMQALMCFSRLYVYARENSGPLRPGVHTMEGAVKTVIGPVYDKFQGIPYDLLKSVDQKVDETVSHLPPSVKNAYASARKAPEVTRSVAGEIHRAGVVGAAADLAKNVAANCEPAAKQLYARYEPVAEDCAAMAWQALHRLPLFPQVAQMAVPTAAHWSEKYNTAVRGAAGRGYAVATFLPLVPTEKISKILGASAEESTPPVAAQ